MKDYYSARRSAIHLFRSGKSADETAQELGQSRSWAYKWKARFEQGSWEALKDCSRAPHHCPAKISSEIRQAVCDVRDELEKEAQQPGELVYIGATAIRSRLRKKKVSPIPSKPSIERILAENGKTKPHVLEAEPEDHYPHLQPHTPLELIQVDIVPHLLPGGTSVACFNAIDVVSRYATGEQMLTKRSKDAASFLIRMWQSLGLPKYTQTDNESCFSGGFTHPGVLGQVLRLALYVGTELIFSPFRHPESNAHVERFHLDYNRNTWQKTEFSGLADIRETSQHFFQLYSLSEHVESLQGQCPQAVHFAQSVFRLSEDFFLPNKLPLTAGRVHFIRKVTAEKKVEILNQGWEVPTASPQQCVWATLEFSQKNARLRIYDAAPDAVQRKCLIEHPFPLHEPVLPLREEFQRPLLVDQSLFSLARNLFRSVIKKRTPAWLSTMF